MARHTTRFGRYDEQHREMSLVIDMRGDLPPGDAHMLVAELMARGGGVLTVERANAIGAAMAHPAAFSWERD